MTDTIPVNQRPAASPVGMSSWVVVLFATIFAGAIAAPCAWAQAQAQAPVPYLPVPGSQPSASPAPASPPPVVQPPPEQTLPAPRRPGLVDEIGKFFQDSPLSLPTLKTPQQTIDDFNNRAKDATDNFSRLSKREVVAGRVKCPVAANGAPDCKSAADKLCVEKGFKEGQSVDSDSAESCSASVLLSGKKAEPSDCRVENFVIRALCQ